jgi:hypothetical protein
MCPFDFGFGYTTWNVNSSSPPFISILCVSSSVLLPVFFCFFVLLQPFYCAEFTLPYELASRVTEADKSGDTSTLNRKLTEVRILILAQIFPFFLSVFMLCL